jgi:hypothetical protein
MWRTRGWTSSILPFDFSNTRAFSSEVEAGSRQGNARQIKSPVSIQSSNIKITGEAEAAAIEARARALGSNPNLVTLVQAERWNGVLPTTMVPGSAVPFVSVK